MYNYKVQVKQNLVISKSGFELIVNKYAVVWYGRSCFTEIITDVDYTNEK